MRVLLGLQPLTTTAYLLRVLPAINSIAGMARSYNLLKKGAGIHLTCV